MNAIFGSEAMLCDVIHQMQSGWDMTWLQRVLLCQAPKIARYQVLRRREMQLRAGLDKPAR